MVVREARRQTSYEPVLEDWIWHGALLLFVGIHNAWDAVVYIALQQRRQEEGEDQGYGI